MSPKTETIGGFEFELATDNDDDAPTFNERDATYEQRWGYSGMMTYFGTLLGVSEATKNDTDDSPLAREYLEAKRKYKRLKKQTPHFKEYARTFETPGFKHRDVTDELAEANPDRSYKYPVFVPDGIEAPAVWDDGDAPEPESEPEPAADADEEICGAETKAGNPCGWKVSRSPCPHHSDDDPEPEADTSSDGDDLGGLDAEKLATVNKMLDAGFSKDEIVSLLA